MGNINHPHRYNSLNIALKRQFGEAVYKLGLDLNLGCPNVDGTIGTEGCIFCNTKANIPTSQMAGPLNLDDQIVKGIKYLKGRYNNVNKFIAYFQNYTNTHAPIDVLRKYFFEPLGHKDIVGVSVSTRPDCVSDEIMDLFKELSEKTYLWVEFGLSTSHNKTLDFIKRKHSAEDFIEASTKIQGANIPVCAHVILGLPGETHDDMMQTAQFLNHHKVAGVKIHNLFILKDTYLEKLYNQGEYRPMTLDEYSKIAVDFIERLDPNIIIHRFNSHGPKNLTVAPAWSTNKIETYNAVENELKKRDTWQGRDCKILY